MKMEKKNRLKKWNNEGFSLVELVIVVAIMAILVGVLAPQYMRYVERSRRSTDVQNATAISSAIQVYAADPEVPAANRLVDSSTITLTTTAAPTYNTPTGGTNQIAAALTLAGITETDIRLRSADWGTAATAVITVNVAADGNVTVEADPAEILTGEAAEPDPAP